MGSLHIKGRVIVSESNTGIVGVAVSDGNHVVPTDRDGYFDFITNEDQRFLFISIPQGYKLPTNQYNQVSFYRNLNIHAEVIFELETSHESQHEYMFLHMTDLHLGHANGMALFHETVLPEINEHKSAFLIAAGDYSFDEGIKPKYHDIIKKIHTPVFSAIGNHDMNMQHEDPKQEYKDLLGPTYYSFNYGEFHYIVLDGCTAAPWRKGWRNVVGTVDVTQMNWLAEDLEFMPKQTPIIVFIHIPIVSDHCERNGLGAKDEPSLEIMNDKELTKIFSQYSVQYVLQGHIHENAHMYEQGVHYIESGAVCGDLWEGNNRDGSPPGYRIVHVSGKSAKTYYKQTGKNPGIHAYSIESPLPNQRLKQGDALCVNVFDGDPQVTVVKYRLNNGKWIKLRPANAQLHPHLWKVQMDISNIADGNYMLEVIMSTPSIDDVSKVIKVTVEH